MVRYMCKEAPYGGELSFSEDSMRDMHNADLCGTLGNLIHRATSLCVKYCGGVVPDVPAPDTVTPIPNLGEVIDAYNAKMNRYELEGGANIAIQGFRDINGYLQDQAPWHIVDNLVAQQVIVRATLEAVYALAHLLLPFLPNGGAKIFCKLGTDPVALCDLNLDCRNLQTGTTIYVGEILYERSVVDDKDKPDAKVETYAEPQAKPNRLPLEITKTTRTNLVLRRWIFEWAKLSKFGTTRPQTSCFASRLMLAKSRGHARSLLGCVSITHWKRCKIGWCWWCAT
jgi:Anticodon binding domain of methionyl tRNA ligase